MGRIRSGLGGRALFHLLRAACGRSDVGGVRGEAGGHAGRRPVLPRDSGSQDQRPGNGAHRTASAAQRGPRARVRPEIRYLFVSFIDSRTLIDAVISVPFFKG